MLNRHLIGSAFNLDQARNWQKDQEFEVALSNLMRSCLKLIKTWDVVSGTVFWDLSPGSSGGGLLVCGRYYGIFFKKMIWQSRNLYKHFCIERKVYEFYLKIHRYFLKYYHCPVLPYMSCIWLLVNLKLLFLIKVLDNKQFIFIYIYYILADFWTVANIGTSTNFVFHTAYMYIMTITKTNRKTA